MSKVAQFQQLQAKLKAMEVEVEQLRNDPRVQRSQECLGMLKELMAEYDMSLEDLVALVKPGAVVVMGDKAVAAPRTRAPRRTKHYKNPHTGEQVSTRGGNHSTLREWREQWGAEAIEGWWTYED